MTGCDSKPYIHVAELPCVSNEQRDRCSLQRVAVWTGKGALGSGAPICSMAPAGHLKLSELQFSTADVKTTRTMDLLRRALQAITS